LESEKTELERQLAAKELEIAELKKTIVDSINAMARNITGETKAIVLGQLQSLHAAIVSLPSSLIPATINLHTKLWGDLSVSLDGFKNGIANLTEDVVDAPARRKQEFERTLNEVAQAALAGREYGQDGNEAKLIRFCKLGVDTSVEPEISYGQSIDQFRSIISLVTEKAFQLLSQERQTLDSETVRKTEQEVCIAFEAWLNPVRLSSEQAVYASDSAHNYTNYFNKLNELIPAAIGRLLGGAPRVTTPETIVPKIKSS
jgi:hypothetical protein